MTTVDEQSNGGQITLKRDDILRIDLHERGGAGYRWTLEPIVHPVCSLMDDTYDEGDPQPGNESVRSWKFKAEKTGDETIALRYHRSWESSGDGMEREFKLSVSVVE
ncbi:MAG: protease inhibitor I42 family protein [Bacteroidota bacterium]